MLEEVRKRKGKEGSLSAISSLIARSASLFDPFAEMILAD
jgi:hypothetical protein